MTTRAIRAAVVAALLLAATGAALAGNGTPAADPVASAVCTAAPRPVAEILAVVGTPRPATPQTTPSRPATPEPGPIEDGPVGTPRLIRVELPAGTAADPATVAAVTETMRGYLACQNAGDVLAMMALVSDDYLRQSFAGRPLTEGQIVAYAATPRPRPAEHQTALLAVREVRVLADGRVGALIDTGVPATANPNAVDTDFVVFAAVDGRYLIDRYIAGVGAWFGPGAATPVP